jgi:vancomycin resistance protein YoaR
VLNGTNLKRRLSRRRAVAGGAATAAAAGIGIAPARCSGKFYPGVAVNGIDVSGMTIEEGEKRLRQELAAFESAAVTFVDGDRSWTASLEDLGMAVDYSSMLSTAMDSVRGEGVLNQYSHLVQRDARHEVSLFLHQDRAALDSFVEGIARDISVEPRDARLYKSGASVETLDHRIGRSLDVDDAIEKATRAVRSGRSATVRLSVSELTPDVTREALEASKAAATRLISEPVVFTLDDREFVLDTDQLSAALSIGGDNSVSLDTARMEDRIAAIERDVAIAPKNVTLAWDGGLYVVEGDTPGRKLDRDALAERLGELAASSDRIAALPVAEVKAPARADNLDELGLETHLASGYSSFVGSSYERAANVEVSARNINYKLIGPGEEFSFNELLGPITEEKGYIAGTIIQGDFAATDIGGGVCQVSTTVFRAAQNAGFQFKEWHPHSWRLAFYEADGSPPGLDAAIYQAHNEWEWELDMRFVNPLDSWLLLMMVVDGNWVSAHFYGKDPGWTVEVFPARVSDPKPIPEPVKKVNPALAPGERRKVGTAQPGYTVWVRRKVTAADGTVIADGDFVSDYVSQPEAWEVGPS